MHKSLADVLFSVVYILLTKRRTSVFDRSATEAIYDIIKNKKYDVKKLIPKISEEFCLIIIWPHQMLGLKESRYASLFCLKIWKLWRATTILKLNIFWWNFAHVFYLPLSMKVVRNFFILFRSWVICKNQKRPAFYTIVFCTFINNSRSKQNKKNPKHLFVDIAR